MTVLTRAASGARISRPARSRRGRRSSAPARVARVGAPGQRPPLTGRGERRSRRPRRKGVFARFVMGALFLFGLVFTGLATTSTTAHAELINIPCSIVPTFYNAGPEALGSGSEGFLPPDKFYPSTPGSPTAKKGASELTVFEQYGVRGAMFSGTTQLDARSLFSDDGKKRECSVSDWGLNLGAQYLFDVNRFVTATQIGIRQRASDSGPLLKIMREMTPSVNTMRDIVFIPGAVVAITATGIWVLFKLRDDQTREVTRGIGWACLAVVLVAWLILPTKQGNSGGTTEVKTGSDSNFYWVAATVNDTRDKALAALSSAVNPGSTTGDICSLPSSAPYAGQRMIDCRIYQGLVFEPWAEAMFGPKGKEAIPITGANSVKFGGQGHAEAKFGPFAITDTKDLRVVLLGAQAFNSDGNFLLSNTKGYTGGKPLSPPLQSPTPNTDRYTITKTDQFQLYQKVFEQVNSDPNGAYGSFPALSGSNASSRLSTALGATVASSMVGVPVVITSLLSTMWNAIPILLFLIVPVVGLFSIYPPMQKHLRSLLQTWAKASVLGFGFGVVQLLGALVISVLMSSPIALGWKCVTLVILIVAMFRIIKGFQEDQFTPNLGGNAGFMDPTDSTSKAGQSARRVTGRVTAGAGRRGTGAVLGTVTGVATASRRGVSNRVENRGPSKKKVAASNEKVATTRAAERARAASGVKGTEAPPEKMVDRFKEEELQELQTSQAKDRATAKEEQPGKVRRTASAVRTGVTSGAAGAGAGGLAASRYQGAGAGIRAGSVDQTGARTGTERSSQRMSRREAIAKESQVSSDAGYQERLEKDRKAGQRVHTKPDHDRATRQPTPRQPTPRPRPVPSGTPRAGSGDDNTGGERVPTDR